MDDVKAILFRTRLEGIVTMREAMRWENEIRLQNGQTIAYDEEAFNRLISEIAELEHDLRG